MDEPVVILVKGQYNPRPLTLVHLDIKIVTLAYIVHSNRVHALEQIPGHFSHFIEGGTEGTK